MKVQLSIVTVSLNDLEHLKITLESVKALSNGFRVEHIVIDGGSSDGTPQYLGTLDYSWLRWVSEKDFGIYDAMNRGLKMVEGEYVQFLNAGDWIREEAMSLLKLVLEKKSDLVIATFNVINADGKVFNKITPKAFRLDLLRDYGTACLNHQSVFIRRELCPLYNTQYKYKGELCWYFEILDKNPVLKVDYIQQSVVCYQRGGLGSQHRWRNLMEWVLIVQRRFGIVQNIRNWPRYRKYLKTHSGHAKYIRDLQKLTPTVD